MVSYHVMVKTFIAELDSTEQFKRETIVRLAEQLEKEEYQTNEINDRISDDLEGHISRAYIGKILEDKYKKKSKVHRKKEEVIELAADGSIIESDKARLEREEAERNALGHEDFSQALEKVSESASKQIEDLDSMVLKELDKVRDENKELATKLNDITDTYQKKLKQQEDVMELIEENLGFYMVFDRNEDNEIFVKEIDSEKANTRKELKIDLRKFEDQIKNSYQKGKHIAELKHNGTQVTSWK